MGGGWGDVWLWWLEHGLDGLGGGVLGGAVAGLVAWWAVQRTIAHERELSATAQADARRTELRREIAGLHAEALGRMVGQPGIVSGWASLDLLRALHQSAAVCGPEDPDLTEDLNLMATELLARMPVAKPVSADTALVLAVAPFTAMVCREWLAGNVEARRTAMRSFEKKIAKVAKIDKATKPTSDSADPADPRP
jgi:hypothetical protein